MDTFQNACSRIKFEKLECLQAHKILTKHEYIYKNETSRNTRKNTDSNFWLISNFLSPSKIIIFTAFRNIFSFFEYKNFTFLQIYQSQNYPIQRNNKKTYSSKRSYFRTRYLNNQHQNHLLLKPNTNALINYAIQRYLSSSCTKSDVNPRLEHFRSNKDKYPTLCKYCKRIGKTKKPKTFFGWIYSLIRGGPKESTPLKKPTCCTTTCKDDDRSKIPLVKEPPVEEKKKTDVKKMSQLAPCVTDSVDTKQTESNTEGAEPCESKVEVKDETSHSGSNIHDKLNELCKKYDLEDVWLSDKADNSCEKHKIPRCSEEQTRKGHDNKLFNIFEMCEPKHKKETKPKCEAEVKSKTNDHKINKTKSSEEIKCKKDKKKDSEQCLEKLKALASSEYKDMPNSEKDSERCIEKLKALTSSEYKEMQGSEKDSENCLEKLKALASSECKDMPNSEKDSERCIEKLKALTSSEYKEMRRSDQNQKTSDHSKEKPCIEKLSKCFEKNKPCTPIISYNVDITSYISKATGKMCDNKTKKNLSDKEYQLSVVLSECPKDGKIRKDPCKKNDEKDKKCQPICSNQSQESLSTKKESSLENTADKHTLDNCNLIIAKVQEIQNKMSVASILNPQEIKETVELLSNNLNNADEVQNKNADENQTLIENNQSDKTNKLSLTNLVEKQDKDVKGNLKLHSQSKHSDEQIIEFFRLAEEQKKYDSTNENTCTLKEEQSIESHKSPKIIDGKEKYDGNDFKVNENLKAFVADDRLKDFKKSSETVSTQENFGDEIKSFDMMKQLNDLDKLSKLIDEITKRNDKIVNGYETSGTKVNQHKPIELSDVAEEEEIKDNGEEKCNEKNVNDYKTLLNTNEQNEAKKLNKKTDRQKEESLFNSKPKQSDEQALKQNYIKPSLSISKQTLCTSEKTDEHIKPKLLEQNPLAALLPEEKKSNLAQSYSSINNCALYKRAKSHPVQFSKESKSATDNTKKRAGVKFKTIAKTKSTISSKKFRDNRLQKQQKVMIKSNTDIYSDMTALLPRKLKKRHQDTQSKKTNEWQRQKNDDNSEIMNDITKIVKFGKVLNEARDPICYSISENCNRAVCEQNMKTNSGDDRNSSNGVLMEYSKILKMASQENETIKNSCSQHAMTQPKLFQPSENLNKPIWDKSINHDTNSIQGMFVKGIGINKFKKLPQENCKIRNTFAQRTAEHQPKQSFREIAEVRLLSHKTQEFCKVMLELVQLFSEYKASSDLQYCDQSIENLRQKQMKIRELHNTVKSLEENLVEFLQLSGNEEVGRPTGSSYNDKYKYFSYEGSEKTSAFDRRRNSVSALPDSQMGRCNQGIRQYKTLSRTKIPAENFARSIKVDKLNSTNEPINKEEFRDTLIDLIFLFTTPDEIFNKSNVASKNRGLKRKQRS